MIPLLGPVARGLIAAYVVILVAAFLPVQLKDLNWQLRIISVILNNAPLPLAGLGLLAIAKGMEPATTKLSLELQRQLVRLRWLAVAAGFGFILLAVVQVRVSLKFLQQSDALHLQQSQQLQKQFVAIRTAIDTAEQPQQLGRAVELLLPPEQRSAVSSQPIHRQRSLLLNQLGTNDLQARRDLNRQRGQRQVAVIVDGLRNLSLCVVFALSFLALKPRIPFLIWLRAAKEES